MRLSRLATLASVLAATSAYASPEPPCDRDCLSALVQQTLVSMARHDPMKLPLGARYKLTVNNVGSGLVMATPWRTITSFTPPPRSHVVIDVPQQQVFFVATVKEGSAPALLWGRLKADDRKLTELELYLGRSKADSGMQFGPTDLARMPPEWSAKVPASQLPSRDELSAAGRAFFQKGALDKDIPGTPTCKMAENGHVVRDWPLLSYMGVPGFPPPEVAYRQGQTEIPCGDISKEPMTPMGAMPLYDKTRLVIDEAQGTVVALAMVPGKALPNFVYPPPGPNPEYPTAFVPDSFSGDQRVRATKLPGELAQTKVPVPVAVPGVLAVVEMHKVFNGHHQGTHRLMQAMPVGSASPWDLE